MTCGDFGDCEKQCEDYRSECHKRFPHALVFLKPEQQVHKQDLFIKQSAMNGASDSTGDYHGECVPETTIPHSTQLAQQV